MSASSSFSAAWLKEQGATVDQLRTLPSRSMQGPAVSHPITLELTAVDLYNCNASIGEKDSWRTEGTSRALLHFFSALKALILDVASVLRLKIRMSGQI